MFALAKKHACPLVVRADGLEAVAALTEKADAAGLKDIVINSMPATPKDALRDAVFARRSALTKKFAPLGYPTITFPSTLAGGDPMLETVYAAMDVAKYGSIIVLTGAEPWRMLPLLVLRQNIFTDPQRPMQAESKIYEINGPGPDSPFFVTTNFSLTYFIVSSEIEGCEGAGVPGCRRRRRPLGAHGVGGRQVRARADREVRHRLRHRREDRRARDHHPRCRRADLGRAGARSSTAGSVTRRAVRGRRHPGVREAPGELGTAAPPQHLAAYKAASLL